ncbi:MAG: preprotein translocase subunit SecE [Pseudodesulfovibrio sp.]|uniref:Protein translocase subunit SecE n=1 Tax=Pseudodesulfovibrio aespoeensis (strain ATCC 700646 / DSM 10631 / Aspo-2) TaxID=643562 RepID=E6VTB3_PSEA9|nr:MULTISPECIES: preprotein translocase subunit SecE [Pseudodesulfovibrio]MBU4378371.1 preprotein translocase subunit SecE [Pseudomonadota bacterium]ADU63272.1 preprotein translocase, SecE subunit [Pseudodesulfovibrio aespoeensis Aspo-2]MBU4475169.1 preprotein translocase subunit SecE [Pseudomonadota bacterium]MBU4516157.1 preprotein translocase subunit SecE [Pseudomonadota bacterium]MBU4523528.1 preprotein translocase subunit SecE [Pseudomonadota bacterium]
MAKKKGKTAAEKQPSTAIAAGPVGKVREFIEFLEESKVEIKKVVWPTRKETITTCVAVLIVSLVVALYLGIVDLALSKIVEAILS